MENKKLREHTGNVSHSSDMARKIEALSNSLNVRRDGELSRFDGLASTSGDTVQDKGEGNGKVN